MVKEFSVRVILRDEKIAILRENYEILNKVLIEFELDPCESFEAYLGMIAEVAYEEYATNISEAVISGVEI